VTQTVGQSTNFVTTMAYLYLLIGIVSLILVWMNQATWGFPMAVILGILFVIFGLFEIFMPRR